MDDKLTVHNIKHNEPELRQMIAEYAMMFSGVNLKLNLVLLCPIGVTLLIFLYGPSLATSTNRFMVVFICINAYFLFGFGGLMFFELVSPLLARLILPLVNLILDVVRMLLWFIQYMTVELSICLITQNFLYPKDEEAK